MQSFPNELLNEDELYQIEASAINGLFVTRQSNCVNDQVIRSISVCHQRSDMDSRIDFLHGELNLSDWLRGGPIFLQPGGTSGLQCSMTKMSNGNAEPVILPCKRPVTEVKETILSAAVSATIPNERERNLIADLPPPIRAESDLVLTYNQWEELKMQPMLSDDSYLFDSIVAILCEYSFSPECTMQVRPYLRAAMPLFDSQLKMAKSHNRSLKIARAISKQVGFGTVKLNREVRE